MDTLRTRVARCRYEEVLRNTATSAEPGCLLGTVVAIIVQDAIVVSDLSHRREVRIERVEGEGWNLVESECRTVVVSSCEAAASTDNARTLRCLCRASSGRYTYFRASAAITSEPLVPTLHLFSNVTPAKQDNCKANETNYNYNYDSCDATWGKAVL